MKLINQLWAFFASVQLAILTLCSIAVTSIIGTVVPQGEAHSVYVDKFGAKTATFFQILDIPTMYSSWWFYGLLGLLSVNLIICSIDRFPAVWRLVTDDNLCITPDRLEKMHFSRKWPVSVEKVTTIDWQAILTTCGWRSETNNHEEIMLFFCQKGRWSRIGVYIVHMSILVIFAGAIIGHFFGFKGSVMIPELRSTEKIFTHSNSIPIDLGFTIRNDSFAIEFYSNGMPKEYRTRLTILENDREILQNDIKVNSPLSHRGITFYQSSYQAHQEFLARVTDTAGNESRQFTLPFQEQISWDDKNLRLGIINVEASGQRALRIKIWCKIAEEPATIQWVNDNETLRVKGGGKEYSLRVKQLYSTGLQVAKDPGVWVVYAGCGLLLLGLYMAFFISHRRIWLCRQITATGAIVYLAGSTNKNKPVFAKEFAKLEESIDRTLLHHIGDPPAN